MSNSTGPTSEGIRASHLWGIALACAVAVWGAGLVVVRGAVQAYPVVGFLFLRMLLGGLLLLALASLGGGVRRWRGAPWTTLGATGLTLAGGYLAQTAGLAMGAPAAVAAAFTSLTVVLVPALLWSIGGRRPGPRVLFSGALIVAGTLLICAAAPSAAAPQGWRLVAALALELASAGAFALQVVLVGRVGSRVPPVALGGIQLVLVALLLIPALPLAGGLPRLSPAVLGAVAFTALGASAFGFAVQAGAQRHLSPANAALIMGTEPGFALVFAAAAGEQTLGFLSLAGLLLLAAATLPSGTRARRVGRWLSLGAGRRLTPHRGTA